MINSKIYSFVDNLGQKEMYNIAIANYNNNVISIYVERISLLKTN